RLDAGAVDDLGLSVCAGERVFALEVLDGTAVDERPPHAGVVGQVRVRKLVPPAQPAKRYVETHRLPAAVRVSPLGLDLLHAARPLRIRVEVGDHGHHRARIGRDRDLAFRPLGHGSPVRSVLRFHSVTGRDYPVETTWACKPFSSTLDTRSWISGARRKPSGAPIPLSGTSSPTRRSSTPFASSPRRWTRSRSSKRTG